MHIAISVFITLISCIGALTVALIGSLVSTISALSRVRQLERQLQEARRPLPQPDIAALEPPSPLTGLRIALDITQDHPHALFANLLKEHLLREDVAEVILGPEGRESADISITGTLTCNGYAEVYYQAEFACRTSAEPICTLTDHPPGGDRPANLAIELVAKLNANLTTLITRQERGQAIRELRSE